MTIAEQYQLLYTILETMDRLFEFWISGSFAVVVAAHFMIGNLSRYLTSFMSLSYTLFSFTLVFRFRGNGTKFSEIRDSLIAAGETVNLDASNFGGVLLFLTFVVGFLGANGYLWYCHLKRSSNLA